MTEHQNLKHQVLHSLKWVVLGKIISQLIRWGMTFWVIRLLVPEDYGVVAMADMVSGFIALFIGGLFAPAIIQTKDLSKEMLKQMFGLILIVYTALFFLQLSVADTIGNFYKSIYVADILKVSAWLFIIRAISIIPSSLLARNMEFKRVSIITSVANITAAVATLLLAYLGYGFWAIVIGEVVSVSLSAIMTFALKPINFLPSFKFTNITEHLKFGSLLTLHSILFYILLHMDVAIGGRLMTAAEIGVFAIALQFALMPQKKLLPLLKDVAFPAFSKIQDQPKRINQYILKAQKLSLLLTVPIFWGLAATVDQIIPLILGEKWLEAIYPTIIILLVMPLRFSEELFNPALKSQRKVKNLILNVLCMMTVMFISILWGVQYGAIGLANAWAFGFPLAFILVVRNNAKLFEISYLSIAKLFFAPVISGLVMLLTIYGIKQITPELSIFNLVAQVLLGGVAFTLALYISDRGALRELQQLVKR